MLYLLVDSCFILIPNTHSHIHLLIEINSISSIHSSLCGVGRMSLKVTGGEHSCIFIQQAAERWLNRAFRLFNLFCDHLWNRSRRNHFWLTKKVLRALSAVTVVELSFYRSTGYGDQVCQPPASSHLA